MSNRSVSGEPVDRLKAIVRDAGADSASSVKTPTDTSDVATRGVTAWDNWPNWNNQI